MFAECDDLNIDDNLVFIEEWEDTLENVEELEEVDIVSWSELALKTWECLIVCVEQVGSIPALILCHWHFEGAVHCCFSVRSSHTDSDHVGRVSELKFDTDRVRVILRQRSTDWLQLSYRRSHARSRLHRCAVKASSYCHTSGADVERLPQKTADLIDAV